MVTQGRVSRVVYYAPDGDQGAYYDPDGRALATGPHLCFRLTRNGTYLDPLRHRSLEAFPLSPQALPAFQVHAEQLLAQL